MLRSAKPRAEETTLLAEGNVTLFTARVDPRTTARVGERVTLAIDPERLYFFSGETGESLDARQSAAATDGASA